ncbi:acid protease [Violaceomyces palustris]|uniref:Acid protease n=1 Tax=Violaceomyces palustris TaxID=1673888 RepID=A0ACD0NTT4_9BASI|nr:acid protease [Violaceomyces palustris]
MQIGLSFVLGLMAASAAFAAPAPEEKGIKIPISKRGSLTHADSDVIDFNKVNAQLSRLSHKYAKNMANYKANTGKDHPLKREANEALRKRGTGAVPLTDQAGESLWTGTITYGTPNQNIPIDFDTGSSDTLVNSGAYKPGSSSTSVKTSKTFSTAYGDGTTASGTVYTDTLHIGGLSATKVAIGLSTTKFIDYAQEGSQGISGMAFPALATFGSNYPPYFYSLKNQGKLNAGVFAFDLDYSGSELYLGGTDSSKYTGSITYFPINSGNGFWQTPATVNGQSISSILDTGTTLIVAPTSEAKSLFSKLGVSSFTQDGTLYGYYNCASPPKVTFNYGGKSVTLSSASTTFGTTNTGDCVLSVVGEDIGIDAWITGDKFLINQYVVFDVDNTRAGLANKA